MEIRALDLQNVKSYERETIPFGRGTNAICGPNGAGKSTILEAIGFALFDVPPCRPIDRLVREGEKTATITVTVAAADEREYQVVRRCGAQNQYYVYDPEIAQRLAIGATDVLAWLREQFGVEDTVDLAVLFHDAAGVPQGLLTAAFLDRPADRKAKFDPLLRVEEYNQAWKELLEARRTLDERVHAGETRIAGLGAEAKALPEIEERAASLAGELATIRARLSEVEGQAAGLAAQKRALEAARERLEALNQEASRLEGQAKGLAAQLQQARQAAERATLAQRALEESAAGHRAYLAAQERRGKLEARETARAQAQQAASEGRAACQVQAERIQGLLQKLQEAGQSAGEAERLRPAAEEQERLEHDLSAAQALARGSQAASERVEKERRHLAELEERLRKVNAALAKRTALEGEREDRERALVELNEALMAARADEERGAARLEQLQAQVEALAAVENARCPVCEGELAAERQAELLERNRERTRLEESLLAEQRRQTAELSGEAQRVAQEREAIQERLARLPRPAERGPLQADCARQEATTREAEREVSRLAEAQSRATALQARLAEVGDPRAAHQRALAFVGQRPALEASLQAERAAMGELEARLEGMEGTLAAFGGLDEALAAARAEVRAHEPAHRRYLQHEREAGELAERQAQVEALQGQLEAAGEARRSLEERLQAAREAYRPEDYERVSGGYLAASEERSRLKAQAQMQRDQLQEAEARIAKLRAIAEDLRAAERELDAWQGVGRLLEHLRKVLKEAGPQVTKALVQVISHQAARLYADIISDQGGRLRWSEDYEVLVEHQGHERSFPQLSGGEQMAAALSVRLALLREVSEIDVIFLDEPTSNLDDTRRDNLADQILGIRDFRQLFVVSHDDTFERATDHTVRIAKVDGASRAVS